VDKLTTDRTVVLTSVLKTYYKIYEPAFSSDIIDNIDNKNTDLYRFLCLIKNLQLMVNN